MKGLDREVAEKVMGLTVSDVKLCGEVEDEPCLEGTEYTSECSHLAMGGSWETCDTKGNCKAKPYTTDVTADYEVLKHVRENWSQYKQICFRVAAQDIWRDRDPTDETFWRYEPGDYSKAAIIAMEEK